MISRIFPGLELIDRELPRDVKIPNKLWSFVWFFVRQVKWPFIAMFLCGIIANMALASEPWFYGQVSALLLKEIGVVEGKDEIFFSSLAGLCFAYIFVVHVFSRSIFSTMSRINNGTFIPFSMMIRRQLGQYLYGHSYRYFQDDYVGRLAGKVMEMPEAIRMILLNSCAHINYCIMQLIIAFVFFLSLDISFALVLMSYVIGCSFIIWWIIKFIGPASYRAIEDMNIVRGRYIDSISNMFLVKVFSRRRQEDLLIRDNLRQAGQSGRHKSLLGFWQEIFQHCCNASFQIALIFLVIHQFQTDVIEISDVVMILTFGIIVTSNSWWLAMLLLEFVQLMEEVRNSIDTVVQNYEVSDRDDSKIMILERSDLSFSDATFSYPGRPVFDGLNLEIKNGEKVGLVGPSGAGKSTLVQLILRLYDLDGGRISLGGVDISSVTQDSLREHIAVIPQSSELLHRSILDNIRFGSDDASYDDVVQAAKLAYADEFILGLVDKDGKRGYEAEVGERGVKLSGGQRQRIALARAILKDAPILILDEATSALDSESEKLIEKSLASVMEGRTVLAIAHRLSTLQSMDRLIVMDQGRIVEMGSHQELLAQNGLYARLWALQTSGFIGEQIE